MDKPDAQGNLAIPVGQAAATPAAAHPCGVHSDAGRALSVLSRDRQRAERCRVLAAIHGAAVLAMRAAVVPLAAPGVEHSRRGHSPHRSRHRRKARSLGSCNGRASGSVLPGSGRGIGGHVHPARAHLFALVMVPARSVRVAMVPPASLSGLFLCRHRGGQLRPRSWLVGNRQRACAALAALGLCRICDIPAVDWSHCLGDGHRQAAFCSSIWLRSRLRAGLRRRRHGGAGIGAALRDAAAADSRQPLGERLRHVSCALRLRGLAAICHAGGGDSCHRQGCDCLYRHIVHELGDNCGLAQHPAWIAPDRQRWPGAGEGLMTAMANPSAMSLAFKLAQRNLFHDRLRLVATVVGIVFSIVLVTVQLGLYFGFGRMVTTMIDHASGDLWIVPAGAKSFEDPSPLDERNRFAALSVNGVFDVTAVVIGFAEWRLPGGGTTPVFVVGSDVRAPGLHPWNVVAGSTDALAIPNTVAVDQTYFERLGVKGLGETAEIRDQKVEVAAITKGIRSFTTTPYVFTSLDRARAYTGTAANKAAFFLVHLAPKANVSSVQKRLQANLTDVEVLTQAEFRERSRTFWLFDTGAGAALFAGALLGVIVGTVIVAQTLYSSTKDHINEFATLRAIGSSGRYIHQVIIWQALLNAVIGFTIAASIGYIIVDQTAESALPIVMTPALTIGLFALTVFMCVTSAIAAIIKVMRIDPAMVFTQ